jgi:serine/threonine protein kinase
MHTANLDKTNKLSENNTPLVEDIKNYKITRLLGRGATSNVYLGIDKTSLGLAQNYALNAASVSSTRCSPSKPRYAGN